ncbi:MAG: hypothetical protein A3A94_02745 [Candidatus Portnoybacteria bacterium RIFCSPLOWO2_01_FULL_43_11]|uniref:Phosphatidic acid phosphatase type 2/haloperoxidase domain-containing protein n=4 Tax=Candidatus Portnoyibacteriota TaxID=1817913 RepID=A0A1G2FAB4_9BACT|nr:MAG: hypothetical protein A2815_01245 [Candidatus Portnoybacteria bacterium RIFCSPHIGHO2_01_FULL_40_12b]OGZ36924.1 MAG: hypothetical protein A3D38_02415 [Candidatus Portnoybacteria bacterium RIFCSPHIGHO2_02_FULL_40_23]OGZ37592.1 MAG: hypothetical protein A3E90_00360 [Candidatus Portnoybacteria bacterium RIFCSPHIGHO2_12_FULL_40_11]OGZ38025.1 MAG: hypothetical protein A3A94_02745 [Candidatus Portnoybacteria bacterium RIFCSPLOWO2_01_FULL_43_11]OGZ39798.1 MAG: hypothetical protein A3I20_00875 [C
MDFYFFSLLNQLAGQWFWLDIAAIFFAGYLEYFLTSLFFLWVLRKFIFRKNERKKTVQLFLWAVFSVVLSRFIITELIRFLYYRPRPFVSHQVNQLLEHSATGSFPSGHAAFFFAFSAIIFLYYKKEHPDSKLWGWAVIIFGISFLISVSRVFVGLHYPSDILAGIIVGIFSGWLMGRNSSRNNLIFGFHKLKN